jgi:hypothetical protein
LVKSCPLTPIWMHSPKLHLDLLHFTKVVNDSFPDFHFHCDSFFC